MKLTSFFNRSLGTWESHRTYLYPTSGTIKSFITTFTWTNPFVNYYDVVWSSINGKGSFNCTFNDDTQIQRGSGYFTSHPTTSRILSISHKVLHTLTIYNNVIFDEKIVFLNDSFRTRRTFGYKQNKDLSQGDLILSGSYQEKKL